VKTRTYDGIADFDTRLLPGLEAIRFFRLATDPEITKSHAAYEASGVDGLLTAWREVASPNRVALPGLFGRAFAQAGALPSVMNGLNFLATVRAAVEAGKRFRGRLSPRTRSAIENEFPWLENRHEHIPPGFSPWFEFPRAFSELVDTEDLDDARARWQLIAALNEVQQTVLTRYLAEHFRIPELVKHAEREEALARNYFAHWSPKVTKKLWRQCILILDALNAQIFALLASSGISIAGRTMWSAIAGRSQWKRFLVNLDEMPQRLIAPPAT